MINIPKLWADGLRASRSSWITTPTPQFSFFFAFGLALFFTIRPGNSGQTALAGSENACALSAPTTLSVIASGATAALTWSPVAGAVAYNVKLYDLSTSTLVSTVVTQGGGASIGRLEAGKTYKIIVAAMCSEGEVSEFVIVEDILT